MEKSGYYQGAETVTSRTRACAEGKVDVISFPVPHLILPCLARLKISRFDNEQDRPRFLHESFDTGDFLREQ